MDLKGARIRNINTLCGDINSQEDIKPMKIVIPYFQRPYKWDDEKIQTLVEDYYRNGCQEYFVGSVVMVTPEDASDRHSVIDGQQRLTTLFLMEYLQFLLLRSYIETRIYSRRTTTVDTLLTNLASLSFNLFGDNVKQIISELYTRIIKPIDKGINSENSDELFSSILTDYEENVFLPYRNYSDPSYDLSYRECLGNLLNNSELALFYDRVSYNVKLKEALSNVVVKTTSDNRPEVYSIYDGEDKIVEKYINAIAQIFGSIAKKSPDSSDAFEYVENLLDTIKGIIKNLKLCAIITGNPNDAYTLFEVLNDRAFEIDDLDLIKNIFYKWYCNHTNETDETLIDGCIEEVDGLWVEEIFTQDLGVEKSKIVSFLAAEYLTADEDLKYADKERYRNSIEGNHLNDLSIYNSGDIKADFYIYLMVSRIIKKFELVVNKKNERVIKSEVSNCSITYRTLHLLNALKQVGVMPAITNTIIRKYLDANATSDFDVAAFDAYLDALMNDDEHSDERFTYIHRISHIFWKLALMCDSADIPREEAKKVIRKINVNNNSYDYVLDASIENERLRAFSDKWMMNWRYDKKSDDNLRAKVLFINLFYTSKNGDVLVFSPTRTQFRTSDLHLDHLEANNPNPAALDRYFIPTTNGESRYDYVNAIGNFMILDQDDNNNKNDLPLYRALSYYDSMCPNGHWMIEEIKTLINSDSDCFREVNGSHVPTEMFFIKRRTRLVKYCKGLLRWSLGSNSFEI